MQIRRQSDPEFEAIRYTGALDSLFSWLVNQADFLSASVDRNLVVRVSTAGGNNIQLSSGDYLRVKEDFTLDRISATGFANNWELVNPPPA